MVETFDDVVERVLEERMEFEFCLADLEREHVIAYGDASGKERLIGVVVFSGEERYFTTWEVPQKLWNMLVPRRNHQINTQELIAMAVMVATFEEVLK